MSWSLRLTGLFCLLLAARSLVTGPRIGVPAPELSVLGLVSAPPDAKAVLSELRGRAVVIEFWTTWCGPCVDAIPHMNQVAAACAAAPVTFIAISDEDQQVLREFVATHELRAWVASDPDGSTRTDYGVRGYPTVVLVGPQGTVEWTGHPLQLEAERILALL